MDVNELPTRYKIELINLIQSNPTGLPFRYGEPLPPVFQQMEDDGYFTRHSAEPGIMRLSPSQKLIDVMASRDEVELCHLVNAEFPPRLIGGYESASV